MQPKFHWVKMKGRPFRRPFNLGDAMGGKYRDFYHIIDEDWDDLILDTFIFTDEQEPYRGPYKSSPNLYPYARDTKNDCSWE